MRRLQSTKEILASWRRCIDLGLSSTAKYPVLCIEESELENRLNENGRLLSIFEDSVESIEDLLCEHTFLLVDNKGVLLKKK